MRKTNPIFLNSSNGLTNHGSRTNQLLSPATSALMAHLKLIAACFTQTLVARVEARETLPRQDAPAPLSRRQVPTNVAVAEFPLQNDAKSVTEKVEVGRVVGKSRVDDVDGIGRDIVLQTRP